MRRAAASKSLHDGLKSLKKGAVLIAGAGGHGREVLEILDSRGIAVHGFLDDDPAKLGTRIDGVEVLGPISSLEASPGKHAVVVAFGSPDLTEAVARRVVRSGHRLAGAQEGSLISPNARVDESAIIFPGVIINTGATIGRCVTVNAAATISHDCVVGDYAFIGPGVHLAGNVSIGPSCFVGIGANVIPGRRCGAHAVIGAGAAVVRDVPAHATAVGVPARIIKSGKPDPSRP